MSLESETDLAELLTNLVRKIEDAKALVIGTKDRFEELEQRKARFEHRIDALRQLAFK
jgi:ribosomal protein L7Ae-like RNA K-turn-binding protein